MRYQFNILNIASFVFIAGCIVYTILKYETLATDEGWGIVAMVTLIGIALATIMVEWVMQKLIRNRITLNVIEFCLLILLGLQSILDSAISSARSKKDKNYTTAADIFSSSFPLRLRNLG